MQIYSAPVTIKATVTSDAKLQLVWIPWGSSCAKDATAVFVL